MADAPPPYTRSLESQMLGFELWFAARLQLAAALPRCEDPIFAGLTSREIRRERCRALILKYNLGARRVIAQQPDTFVDCFVRLFQQPLVPPAGPQELSLELSPPEDSVSA
jgi:hypothetical protein